MESAFNTSLWDLSLPPSLPALADDDFIALLQKQFGGNIPGLDANKQTPQTANINPQNLSRVPIPKPIETPPSDDSPSPPSATDAPSSRSRRQSGVNIDQDSGMPSDLGDEDDLTLKRKASEDDLDDEPNYKSQHTSLSKRSSSRRKSTGNASVDESRLLKRKEQNRAAQRAFRERKEKHVKDLEDKVAALEERNATTQQENETLREVVSRLQTENVRLRQTSFTFSVPPTASSSGSDNDKISTSRQQNSPMTLFSPPSTTTSTTASSHDSPQSFFSNEKGDNGSRLSFLDGLTMLNPSEPQQTATSDAMNLDFGFGPVFTSTPYTTIASNPLFMSFREPDPLYDALLQPSQHSQQPFDFSQHLMASWPDVSSIDNSQPLANNHSTNNSQMQAFDLTNSLDEIFRLSPDYINRSNPTVGSTPSLSPVIHQNTKSPSIGSSGSGSSPADSSPIPGSESCRDKSGGKCSRADIQRFIAADPGSIFTQPSASTSPQSSADASPSSSAAQAAVDAGEACSEFPPCKGLQLPKTQKSEKNVEVMSAWRKIRHDPKFQDVDINQLCSEFASKAKCDGCQVVIEPTGMQEILESVQKHKRAKQQSNLFSASNSLTAAAGGNGFNVLSK